MNNRIIRSVATFLFVVAAVTATSFAVGNGGKHEGAFTVSDELAVETLVLKQGSTGATVKQIQQKLKNWGYYTGAVDGIFGSQTRKAVVYFQSKNGLVADGIVGTKTLAALGIVVTNTQQTANSAYSSSDTNLLARLIYAEARGEPYTGQVAVGAVVLNRVKSSSFPNTISGVIYQPYAFTCVQDGQINLAPDQTALSAAKDAMNGWDPSYGSLYYYNPAVATSKWIFSRKTVVTIGEHVFAL
ncbi:MAG: spore cortex-lytic enzyme [Candidatus Borkfalkiaceae bacterium]|nr:spore cortex-lytic enzyme [Christensenellaceae bacterium]